MRRRKTFRYRQPPTCPKCGSESIVRIAYGEPGDEMMKESREGKIILGGCVIMGDDPDRHCNDCKHQWKAAGRG